MGSSVLVPSNGGAVTSFVNGAWLDSRFGFKPSFEHVVNHVYHATTTNVDFSHKANQVEDEVNLWVENATRGLIKSIIPAGTITSDTTLILANALYFKGAWDHKLNPSLSKPKTFHLLNGLTTHIPFMNARKHQQFLFGPFNGYKVVQLPYQRGQDTRRFSMCFFLPNARNGLKSLIDKFKANHDILFNPSGLWKRTLSELCIPKFKISFWFEALSASRELGIEQLLNLGDFTEIVDSVQSVSVLKLLHKAFVEVNEEGTEAAAATIAVLHMNCAGPIEFPSFIADHPFVFTIKEDNSRTTIFFGAVINPLSVP